jgi:argininosuccinate lyase
MSTSKPIWDRGDAIDPEMLAFTIGDDWLMDRRLVEHDVRGSVAHVDGLERVHLVTPAEAEAIRVGPGHDRRRVPGGDLHGHAER